MDPLRWIDGELAELRDQALLRERRSPVNGPGPRIELGGRSFLNLSSNDYLSLASRNGNSATVGAGASRLITGDTVAHRELERGLAAWLGVEDALVFSSGYAANVGAIAALSGDRSLVISDALNHASIIDGCRLGRGRVVVVPHRNVEAVERALSSAPEPKRLVVTEGYFSMDGDLAPLAGLRAVCDRHGAALYVDEAHALGVWGPAGTGACAAAGVRADVLMGTLGKAFGASGAFVAGNRSVVSWLWNRARSFVFSTALSPVVVSAASAALVDVRAGERTERLLENAGHFRAALHQSGSAALCTSSGPIVPIVLGSAEKTLRASAALLDAGILAVPIRPPTVPRETSRLRLTVQADHTLDELAMAAAVIGREIS